MESGFRDDEIVKVQGKQYPLVGGRLRLAHEKNDELSILTNIIDINEDRVIVQANVKTDKGNFSGLGNASSKRDRMLSNALIELAETRAIARALRFAGYGMEYTGFEEMPQEGKIETSEQNIEPASISQLEAIASLAKNNNISANKLHEMMYEITGKTKSKELNNIEANLLLKRLKELIKSGSTKIS